MLAQERAERPVIAVDGGGTLVLREERLSAPGWEQAVVKAEIVAAGLAEGGIDAMALSSRDWKLGLPKVLALREAHELPLLAANLTCGDQRPLPATAVVERGGLKVAVVGVTDGEVEGCAVGPAHQAAAEALEGVEADLTVALLPLGPRARQAWDEAGVPVDLVVDGFDGRRTDRPERSGGAWELSPGARGQVLGLADLRPGEGAGEWVPADREQVLEEQVSTWAERVETARAEAEQAAQPAHAERWLAQAAHYEAQIAEARERIAALGSGAPVHRFGWRLVALDDDIGDHAATAALVAEGKERIAATERPAGEAVATGPRAVPGDGPFAGSATCASCHPEQQAQWQGTGHASAWASLEEFGRTLDRQCIGCHVTAWGAEGGPEAPAKVGPWRDVQCESCHGPSAAHVADPAGVSPVRDPSLDTCTACHDGVQDQGRFDPETYQPKVVH